MNRTWKVAIDLVDASGVRSNYPITTTDVARSVPTGPWPEGLAINRIGPDQAVRKIVEELARARSLADQLAARLGRAAATPPRLR